MPSRLLGLHRYAPLSRTPLPTAHRQPHPVSLTLAKPALFCPILFAILSVSIVLNPHRLSPSFTSFNLRSAQNLHLPPPLSLQFKHVHRPASSPLPRPPDWRRPSTLTVHARPSGAQDYILTIFTTGVDAGWFQRDLKLVGCAISDRLYPAALVQPEMVSCRISGSLPPNGAAITALLRWDDALQSAIDNPHWISGVSFPILDDDVTLAPMRYPPDRTPNFTLAGEAVGFIHSDIRWYPSLYESPTPTAPRYELCLMTQIKHDAHLLPDWFKFYRNMGVDKFFLYDNGAPSNLARFANDYIEVVYWPWTRSQSQAYTHFLLASKVRCQFSAFFDVDEYAVVGSEQPKMLKAYMDHRVAQGYGQVVFPQLQMTSNGYVKRPRGSVPERYTRAEEYQRGFGVKPILSTDVYWTSHRINRAFGNEASTYFNMSVNPSPKTFDDNGIIVHYLSRSWEEFVAKRQEGSTAVTERYLPPALLNISNPQAWYLSQHHSRDMFEFREFWRRVIRMKDQGEILTVWSQGSEACRQWHCPRCLFQKVRKASCKHR